MIQAFTHHQKRCFVREESAVTAVIMTGAIALLITTTGCEQYNPRSHWQSLMMEKHTTDKPIITLTDSGDIPQTSSDAPALSDEEQKYTNFCAACHGADGQANTPAILAMNPAPRNLTDAIWQDSVDDTHIAQVIKRGGAAMGLSVTMAPWGGILTDEEIDRIVVLIRSWKQ